MKAITSRLISAMDAPPDTPADPDADAADTDGLSIHPKIAWSGLAFGILWKEEEDPADVMSTPWNFDTWFVTVTCP